MQARDADAQFCLDILSTLHPYVPCRIFHEDYVYARNPDKVAPIISAEDLAFYGKLPPKEHMLALKSMRPSFSKTEK